MNESSLMPAADRATIDWALLATRNHFKCPSCDSIVYSRKSRFCGVCGENLPATFQFSQAERATVATLLQTERTKHRQWLSRREDQGWRLMPVQ
jgi:hypothetical protein